MSTKGRKVENEAEEKDVHMASQPDDTDNLMQSQELDVPDEQMPSQEQE